MRISFDTDGTKTDFYKFVLSSSKYLKKKYNMDIINPKGIEVEDVFDIENILISRGLSKNDASLETKKILDKFWISHRFIKFSLLMRFRKGVRKRIKEFKKQRT